MRYCKALLQLVHLNVAGCQSKNGIETTFRTNLSTREENRHIDKYNM